MAFVHARIYAHTCLWQYFGLSLGLLGLFMVGSFPFFKNSNPGEYDWIVSTSGYSEDQDAIGSATDGVDTLVATDAGPRTTQSFIHSMFIIYEFNDKSTDTNFVTPDHVQELCVIESNFFKLEDYSDFCVLNADGDCRDPSLSFPLQFYGMDHDWSCPLLTATEVDTKANDMIAALSTEVGLLNYGFFFDKDVETRGHATKVSHTHTRKHSRTHSRMHARTHTRTHAHTLTRTHAHTHTRTHAHTHTRTHAHCPMDLWHLTKVLGPVFVWARCPPRGLCFRDGRPDRAVHVVRGLLRGLGEGHVAVLRQEKRAGVIRVRRRARQGGPGDQVSF